MCKDLPVRACLPSGVHSEGTHVVYPAEAALSRGSVLQSKTSAPIHREWVLIPFLAARRIAAAVVCNGGLSWNLSSVTESSIPLDPQIPRQPLQPHPPSLSQSSVGRCFPSTPFPPSCTRGPGSLIQQYLLESLPHRTALGRYGVRLMILLRSPRLALFFFRYILPIELSASRDDLMMTFAGRCKQSS